METRDNSLTKLQLDALKEISSIGAGNASTALSQFINTKVQMTVPEVIVTTVAEVPQLIAKEIPIITMVVLEILSQISGHMLVVFEQRNALSLIDLLMGRDLSPAKATLSEMDISALKEVATVMSGSYLRVLEDTINITLKMTPPCFISGAPNNIPDLIFKHSIKGEEIAICLKSNLYVEAAISISGYLVLIPSSSSLKVLLKLLGMEEDNVPAQ